MILDIYLSPAVWKLSAAREVSLFSFEDLFFLGGKKCTSVQIWKEEDMEGRRYGKTKIWKEEDSYGKKKMGVEYMR